MPHHIVVNTLQGIGSNITEINATNITQGTINNDRLPSHIVVNTLQGIGSNITNINANNIISGTISNSRLPDNININSNLIINGNLSIGTSNLSEKLNITGNTIMDGNLTINGNITLNGNGLYNDLDVRNILSSDAGEGLVYDSTTNKLNVNTFDITSNIINTINNDSNLYLLGSYSNFDYFTHNSNYNISNISIIDNKIFDINIDDFKKGDIIKLYNLDGSYEYKNIYGIYSNYLTVYDNTNNVEYTSNLISYNYLSKQNYTILFNVLNNTTTNNIVNNNYTSVNILKEDIYDFNIDINYNLEKGSDFIKLYIKNNNIIIKEYDFLPITNDNNLTTTFNINFKTNLSLNDIITFETNYKINNASLSIFNYNYKNITINNDNHTFSTDYFTNINNVISLNDNISSNILSSLNAGNNVINNDSNLYLLGSYSNFDYFTHNSNYNISNISIIDNKIFDINIDDFKKGDIIKLYNLDGSYEYKNIYGIYSNYLTVYDNTNNVEYTSNLISYNYLSKQNYTILFNVLNNTTTNNIVNNNYTSVNILKEDIYDFNIDINYNLEKGSDFIKLYIKNNNIIIKEYDFLPITNDNNLTTTFNINFKTNLSLNDIITFETNYKINNASLSIFNYNYKNITINNDNHTFSTDYFTNINNVISLNDNISSNILSSLNAGNNVIIRDDNGVSKIDIDLSTINGTFSSGNAGQNVYITNINGVNKINANVPLTSNNNGISVDNNFGIGTTSPNELLHIVDNQSDIFKVSSTKLEIGTHIIPKSNASYDIGSAEYKIRHLYLSDNSLWIGDKHKISITSEDKISFKKRKITKIPQILNGYDVTNYIQNNLNINDISKITLSQWLEMCKYFTNEEYDINDLFPDNDEDNFEQNLDLNTINDTIQQLKGRIEALEATINAQ